MSISANDLVGYLRAEFDKASKWRLILLVVQFLAVVPTALSVVIAGETLLYLLAIVGPILIVVWWIVRGVYRRARSAAHSARRASLILGGLGAEFSPEEYQRLRQVFTVDEGLAEAKINPDYYASGAPPGYRRLGELLEESAFYSKDIHRMSGNAMGALFVGFIALAVAAALASVPFTDRVTAITGIKVVIAILVFLLSSDVFGAMTEHREAFREAESVQSRMAAAHAKGFPQGDVLLAMTDYNNAMESAPEAVPGVFASMENRLNRRWAEYKRDRDEARAATGSDGS